MPQRVLRWRIPFTPASISWRPHSYLTSASQNVTTTSHRPNYAIRKNIANLALVLTNRSQTRTILSTLRTSNTMLWWIIGGALALLALVLYVPLLRELFGFALLHLIDLIVCLAAGFASILWFEGLKVIRKHRISA